MRPGGLARRVSALLALATGVWALCGASPASSASRAGIAELGNAPAGQQVSLVLPLVADDAGLKRFALAVSDPRSSLYTRYESVDEISRRFGARPTVRARVLAYLRSHGATNTTIDATGLLAEATVTAGLAQRLFGTPLARYRAADGSRFIAPAAAAPSAAEIPAALRGLVEGVVGLDTRPVARTPARSATARFAQNQSSALHRSGTPAGCPAGQAAGEQSGDPTTAAFTPNQYLTAYDFPLPSSGITGRGERAALIEIDGFKSSDVANFAQCFGIAVPPLNTFGVGITASLPPGPEATVDVELLDAAAPGLSSIDVYESRSDSAAVLRALVAPLQTRGHKPQVVSVSLGLCEQNQSAAAGAAGVAAAERSLEAATAAGVTYVAATGDNGSADCVDSRGAPVRKLAVNYPASSWWVTGVGGTNLGLTPANQIVAQPVWNDTPAVFGASGGGLSVLFNRPSYQDGSVRQNARSVPDVSMLGDLVPGYAVYCTVGGPCSAPWSSIGGTSAGTPLLAGGVALMDQELRARGRQDVGFLNPLLYTLGRSSARRTVFSDVTVGGNDVGTSLPTGTGRPLGCCTAKVGYDDASGWGSVDIAHFARAAIGRVPYILGRLTLRLPRHQRPVSRRAVLATVTCSRACDMGAFADLRIGRSRPFEVDSGVYNLRHGGKKTIRLVFSPRQLRSLRFALSNHTSIVATVFGVNTTPDGTIETQTRGQRLTIRS